MHGFDLIKLSDKKKMTVITVEKFTEYWRQRSKQSKKES